MRGAGGGCNIRLIWFGEDAEVRRGGVAAALVDAAGVVRRAVATPVAVVEHHVIDVGPTTTQTQQDSRVRSSVPWHVQLWLCQRRTTEKPPKPRRRVVWAVDTSHTTYILTTSPNVEMWRATQIWFAS